MTRHTINVRHFQYNRETSTREAIDKFEPVSAFATTTYKWGLVNLDTNTVIYWFKTKKAAKAAGAGFAPMHHGITHAINPRSLRSPA